MRISRRKEGKVRLDENNVPIDALDWTIDDWRDLWNGLRRIQGMIGNRRLSRWDAPTTVKTSNQNNFSGEDGYR